MKSISLYVDNGTYLTKLHPYTKLLYVMTAIAVSVIIGNIWGFVIFIGLSLLALTSGKVLKKTFPLITFSFTIILVIFIIHGMFYHENENVLFQIWKLTFYKEGVLYATKIGLNVLNMLLAFAVFVLTTKPDILVEEMEKSGFSPKFGYVVSSVFQIIPEMTGTMNTIMDAQKSRGMETEGNLLTRAKAFLPLISPVVMSSLINTRERAIALEVRGFGVKRKKTYLREFKKQKSDRILVPLFLLAILASVVWKVIVCLL